MRCILEFGAARWVHHGSHEPGRAAGAGSQWCDLCRIVESAENERGHILGRTFTSVLRPCQRADAKVSFMLNRSGRTSTVSGMRRLIPRDVGERSSPSGGVLIEGIRTTAGWHLTLRCHPTPSGRGCTNSDDSLNRGRPISGRLARSSIGLTGVTTCQFCPAAHSSRCRSCDTLSV